MKAFNYFDTDNGNHRIRKLVLATTHGMSRMFPRFSAWLGSRFLLHTRAPKHTHFDLISPHDTWRLDSRAGKFDVHLFGTGDQVAVVSHGWGDTSSSLQPLIQVLLDRGYRVAAIDHVGHGASEGKRSHLLAFIDAFNISVATLEQRGFQVSTLIGHSMGGMAILNLPETLLARCNIVLIAVPIDFFGLMFNTIERFGIARQFMMHLLERVTSHYDVDWDELHYEQLHHKLHQRMLFVHDRQDRYAPFDDVQNFVGQGNAQLLVTEGLGHRRILSDSDVLNQIKQKIATV